MGRSALCAGEHGTLKEDIIRDNPVKATLAGGGRAFGAMIFELFSPGLPQICKNAGADFILYDMEHTGLGLETLKPLPFHPLDHYGDGMRLSLNTGSWIWGLPLVHASLSGPAHP